jgi:hypothetical protein
MQSLMAETLAIASVTDSPSLSASQSPLPPSLKARNERVMKTHLQGNKPESQSINESRMQPYTVATDPALSCALPDIDD